MTPDERDRRARIINRAHDAWAIAHAADPDCHDPGDAAKRGPTDYGVHHVDVSCPPDVEADLRDRTNAALLAEGLDPL